MNTPSGCKKPPDRLKMPSGMPMPYIQQAQEKQRTQFKAIEEGYAEKNSRRAPTKISSNENARKAKLSKDMKDKKDKKAKKHSMVANRNNSGVVAQCTTQMLEESKVENEDFFHGFLPREDINRMLQKKGDFLVRKSEVNGELRHVLSVFWDDLQRHVVIHMTMDSGRNEYTLDPTVKVDRFPDITKLINFYHKNKHPLPRCGYILMNPIGRADWELRHEQITTDKKLGEGAFGEVYKGTLKKNNGKIVQCAIKRSHAGIELSKMQIAEIVAESRLMQKFDHENVVHLYGVAAERQPIMIVMELVAGGSLNSYLKKNEGKVSDDTKLKFCRDAAKGMEYLHNMETIHRDIAARNCLLSDELSIKISDFGLSCEGTHFKMTSNMKLPVRWLAPETLTTATFTLATDVWSFGIMLWEIWHDGQEPYPNMKVMEVQKEVKNGYRMLLHGDRAVPTPIKIIMHRTWDTDPVSRGSMKQIRTDLDEIKLTTSATPIGQTLPGSDGKSAYHPRTISTETPSKK